MNSELDNRPILLIVEDSPEDFELIRRGLLKAGLEHSLHHCLDGDAALDYLQAQDANVRLPALILLDLNLPGTDGKQVLEEIKNDNRLALIPTVIFSNSNNINDVNACYALGANSFVEKPLGPAAFADVMQQLRDYWLQRVRLPEPDRRN
ncbi:MAG: response regulator [Gammaproteobacteria bacterium]|nr:response regulator [Gammaproteobacteria bacterium]